MHWCNCRAFTNSRQQSKLLGRESITGIKRQWSQVSMVKKQRQDRAMTSNQRGSATLPQLRVGDRIWVRLGTQSRTPAEETNAAGTAYVLALPFDIQVSKALVDPLVSHLPACQIKIYPPFRMDDREGSEIEQVRAERVPGVSPKSDSLSFPRSLSLGRQIDPDAVIANAMRLDFVPDPGMNRANELALQLIGLMRLYTKQWWIGKDRRYAEALLRHTFPVSTQGEPLGRQHSYAFVYARLNIERVLDPSIFALLSSDFANDARIPMSAEYLLDAVHSHAIGDIRRSILDAALAAECIRDEAAEHLLSNRATSKADVSRALSGVDLLKHVSTGFKSLVGRSFAEDHPDAFAELRALWAARGGVAHGRIPMAPFAEGSREVSMDDQFKLVLAVFKLFVWMQLIQHESTKPRTTG
jgi:hypothetical protein